LSLNQGKQRESLIPIIQEDAPASARLFVIFNVESKCDESVLKSSGLTPLAKYPTGNQRC
jgi:hypothetical protein